MTETKTLNDLGSNAGLEEMPLVVRDFSYRVAVTSREPSAELVQLLAQAMDSYHDISDTERAGVVQWFSTRYGPTANAELRGATDD